MCTPAQPFLNPLVFKNGLGNRPIYHQLDTLVEAHIFVCFQACCL